MAASNRHKFSFTNIGTSTLLMILIVLCMTIFALLSLSTAISDHQAAVRAADHTTDYYNACNYAEAKLADIDAALQGFYTEASDFASYQECLRTYSLAHPDITLNEGSEHMTLAWQTPLSDTQALSVTLDILYPATDSDKSTASHIEASDSDAEPLYRIASWQVISTVQWDGDNSVTLIGE